MKFDIEKKRAITLYLLEKIEQNDESISKTVAENFNVNQNTVHSYINALAKKNYIKRVKRGKYELVSRESTHEFKRSNGDLNNDTHAYNYCLKNRISLMSSNIQHIWSYVFSEMINNVADHSMAENVTVHFKQNYLYTEVTISDDGVGIFEKIRDYFKLESLDEAICELFKGKLTTDSENHSGEGIFFSSKMMDEFFIISSGKIFTNNKYDNSKISDIAESNPTGTCVIMRLSNFSKKNPQEIFDTYADVDGGFTKTRLPLKNIFETSPVSRSQAKRVCNRLENFEEVTLDFEGISWMGQGFAHQLFSVFSKEHPDIKLIPENMNEDVTKMYIHVVNANSGS
jgi:anti-sigma regulatory factor (Ser/Thr protein kinase)